MKSKQPYNRNPQPNKSPARNSIGNAASNNKPNAWDEGDEIASVTKKKQPLRYFEGRSKAGKGSPYSPSDVGAIGDATEAGNPGMADMPPYPGGPGNDLSEFRDLSTKTPYGRPGMGWAEKSGKLGDLDPQETDQPAWVNTWSPMVKGPYGTGPTNDENYDAERPRTFSRQLDRFEACNPEFQDVADHGDWTSLKWDRNV